MGVYSVASCGCDLEQDSHYCMKHLSPGPPGVGHKDHPRPWCCQQEPGGSPVLSDSAGVLLVFCTPHEATPSPSSLLLFFHHVEMKKLRPVEMAAGSRRGIRKWRSQAGGVPQLVVFA